MIIAKKNEQAIPKSKKNKLYLINKPAGIISTCLDDLKRKTVIDLLPSDLQKGMYPIGRLDKESRGALLISNIGILSLHLTHPKYNHKKRTKYGFMEFLQRTKIANIGLNGLKEGMWKEIKEPEWHPLIR